MVAHDRGDHLRAQSPGHPGEPGTIDGRQKTHTPDVGGLQSLPRLREHGLGRVGDGETGRRKLGERTLDERAGAGSGVEPVRGLAGHGTDDVERLTVDLVVERNDAAHLGIVLGSGMCGLVVTGQAHGRMGTRAPPQQACHATAAQGRSSGTPVNCSGDFDSTPRRITGRVSLGMVRK